MYSDLTDEELDAEIVELRGKVKEVMSGGAVQVIAGEGRRIEYTRSNIDGLESLLRSALNEREKRSNGGRLRGRAIRPRFSF